MTLRRSWTPQRALAAIDHAARRAEERAAERLLVAANQRVPYNLGELQASGHVFQADDGMAVGYTAPHARFVHAHPEWNFELGRSGHWLEETMEATAEEEHAVMASTVRADWPR